MARHGYFGSVNAYLRRRNCDAAASRAEVRDIILAHLDSLYSFYGEDTGVRIARKHLGWYCEQLLRDPAQVRRESDGGCEHRCTVRAAHATISMTG